jgi:hypothetical protein
VPESVPSASGRHRAAWVIGMLLNPLTLPPLIMGLAAAHAEAPGLLVRRIVIVSAVMYLFVPLVFLILLKRTGRIATIEARDQKARSRAMWAGVGILGAAAAAMAAAAAEVRPVILAIAGVLLLQGILAAGITPRLKLSLHVAAMAGAFSILASLGPLSGTPLPGGHALLPALAVLIPLLAWARHADHAHSASEVRAGLAFGLILPPFELALMHALLPLWP